MKSPEQLLKELSLDLRRHNPYVEGDEAGFVYWDQGARFVVSRIQDLLRDNEPSEMPEIDDD